MADSPERDQAQRGSCIGAFISGRFRKKLADSLFPGPYVVLKPNVVWRPWRKRRLFPSLLASLYPIATRVRNRLEAGNKRQG
jgi:hypothetical protein